jgi:hypothetical protein
MYCEDYSKVIHLLRMLDINGLIQIGSERVQIIDSQTFYFSAPKIMHYNSGDPL